MKASTGNEEDRESTLKYWLALREIVRGHEGLSIRWEAHGMRGDSEFEEFLDFTGPSDLIQLQRQCTKHAETLRAIASRIALLPKEGVDSEAALLGCAWINSCSRIATLLERIVQEARAMVQYLKDNHSSFPTEEDWDKLIDVCDTVTDALRRGKERPNFDLPALPDNSRECEYYARTDALKVRLHTIEKETDLLHEEGELLRTEFACRYLREFPALDVLPKHP